MAMWQSALPGETEKAVSLGLSSSSHKATDTTTGPIFMTAFNPSYLGETLPTNTLRTKCAAMNFGEQRQS